MSELPPIAAGRLLVATPGLRDPNFSQTVVLLLAAGSTGALGIILNRPTETPVAEVLPAWAPLAAAPAVVFAGGPVEPSAAILLGATPDGWTAVDANEEPAAGRYSRVRLFAAYAGWGAEQLEGEVAAGGWYVLPSLPGDPFTATPEHLWRHVLRRHGGRYALAANAPADPRMN